MKMRSTNVKKSKICGHRYDIENNALANFIFRPQVALNHRMTK
jgi:hypothetical protein